MNALHSAWQDKRNISLHISRTEEDTRRMSFRRETAVGEGGAIP
jgi:hypothetical protein